MTQDTDYYRYANGIGAFKNKQDLDRAYPLFVLAAKHNHADAHVAYGRGRVVKTARVAGYSLLRA
jgi:TPR repeat protein